MKYSITIEGDARKEIGDTLFVFLGSTDEQIIMDKIVDFCYYKEVSINAIKPKLHQNINWNGALIFEYLCGTNAYYSDDIATSFNPGSFRKVYYNKEDAEKEQNQRINLIGEKIKSFKDA